jgi:hypothetical protein
MSHKNDTIDQDIERFREVCWELNEVGVKPTVGGKTVDWAEVGIWNGKTNRGYEALPKWPTQKLAQGEIFYGPPDDPTGEVSMVAPDGVTYLGERGIPL